MQGSRWEQLLRRRSDRHVQVTTPDKTSRQILTQKGKQPVKRSRTQHAVAEALGHLMQAESTGVTSMQCSSSHCFPTAVQAAQAHSCDLETLTLAL